MIVAERIRRCRYCRSNMMKVPPMSYAENPFCVGCLPERAPPDRGPGEWVVGNDGYARWQPAKGQS